MTVPSGSNDTTNPYTDDVYLDTMTFNGNTFTGNQIVTAQSVYVVSNRANVNAEYGDNDTAADGDPNPFTRASLDLNDQETTNPPIQDTALAYAFISRSLTEGSDGENDFTFNIIFNAGVVDNDGVAPDSVPEIVIFERGNNDTTTVRGITGGTFNNPTLTDAVTILPNQANNTNLSIDTREIDSAQELVPVGIDISDLAGNSTLWGIQITSNGGDFFGLFFTAEDPDRQFAPFVPNDLINPNGVNTPIPEPDSWLVLVILCLAALKQRRRIV